MADPEFVIWVCPVCDNLAAYGKASDDLERQRTARPHCWGSDAPGYPGSHEHTPMDAVEVARV